MPYEGVDYEVLGKPKFPVLCSMWEHVSHFYMLFLQLPDIN